MAFAGHNRGKGRFPGGFSHFTLAKRTSLDEDGPNLERMNWKHQCPYCGHYNYLEDKVKRCGKCSHR